MAEDTNIREAQGVAETAFRLMHFIITTERKSRGTELKTRQDVLSLYAICHRVTRGEPFIAAGQKPGKGGGKGGKPAKPETEASAADAGAEVDLD